MRQVKIITDSCADMSAALLAEYDVDYARMSTLLDGAEKAAELTWSDAEAKALYDTMRGGKRFITAQVSVEEFQRIFNLYLDQGFDILYIACSSRLSGSVNTGRLVAQKLMEERDGAKIVVIDSLCSSIGEGILVMHAAKLLREGKTLDEVVEVIMGMRNNVHQFGTVHSLEHLKKAGRVSAPAAFFGDLMGVKPIVISDANGAIVAIKKVKGRQNSLRELVKLMKEAVADHPLQTIYLAHADCSKEEIDFLVGLVREEIPCTDVHIGYIGPIVGSSVGPETIGLWAVGKEVIFKAD